MAEPIGEPDCTRRMGCRWAPACFDGTCNKADGPDVTTPHESTSARLRRVEQDLHLALAELSSANAELARLRATRATS